MKITIESVDQVLERVPYATYAEAKEALVETDGDVLDAIIFLENKFDEEAEAGIKKRDLFNLDLKMFDADKLKGLFKRGKLELKDEELEGDEEKVEDKSEGFKDKFDYEKVKEQIQDILKKSGVVRFIVEKDGKTVLNIPITIGVAGAILVPTVSIVGLSIAVLTRCSLKVVNEEEDEVVDLGEFSEEKFNMVKDIISSTIDKVGKKKDFQGEDKQEEVVDAVIVEEEKDAEETKEDQETKEGE